LSRKDAAQWVLEGDIKGCLDHISHEWLVNNIPVDKMILQKWLKSGFMLNKQLYTTEEGTPQGGIISPTLANMTLDGIQKVLNEKFKIRKIKGNQYNPKVNLVRYADDFIITAQSKEILELEIMPLLKEFLKERGLTLSEEKTKITHIDEGFDFLGFNIRKYNNGVLLIKPSKDSQKKFKEKIKEVMNAHKSITQESLIRLLNPIITGWANYYQHCSAAKVFQEMNSHIFQKLQQWSLRRHPAKGKGWVVINTFITTRAGRGFSPLRL
jgi:RNA-directed DNA polymerase